MLISSFNGVSTICSLTVRGSKAGCAVLRCDAMRQAPNNERYECGRARDGGVAATGAGRAVWGRRRRRRAWGSAAPVESAAGAGLRDRASDADGGAPRPGRGAPEAGSAGGRIRGCGADRWPGVLESGDAARPRPLPAVADERAGQPAADLHLRTQHHGGGHVHVRHRHLPRTDRHDRVHATQPRNRRAGPDDPVQAGDRPARPATPADRCGTVACASPVRGCRNSPHRR